MTIRFLLRALLSTLGTLIALTTLPAAAQPATPMRLPDTIEQRAAACIACHGREGSSSNAGYFPRLAGKPEGYLFNQLRSFRDGRRFNGHMVYMVQHLSDAYLLELARYFAELDLPYAKPVPSDASPEVLREGERLVRQGDPQRDLPACASCHGNALTGVQPAIPGLLGLPRLYVASQLGDWLTDSRHALPPDCMAEIGRKLTTADINAVASWLSAQPVPADAKAVAALPHPLPRPCSAMP